MTHPALITPASRACVEALYRANPEGTAELGVFDPGATYSWCGGHEPSSRFEGENPLNTRVEGGGKVVVETYRQGRLL